MFKKSFDNPTVQSSIDVIIPVIMKKIKRANPMSKAYSTRFPPYSSEKKFLIVEPIFFRKSLIFILIFNLNLAF